LNTLCLLWYSFPLKCPFWQSTVHLVARGLFGREKEAYITSLTRMTGRFAAADGAMHLLAETGKLPLVLQAKLIAE
jgi:transcriptional regulator with GAF, ATPase, and Fis domain